jgi:hypothetical protein
MVPFHQTAPAARGGCMLSSKNRMAFVWRLSAVVFGLSRRQSLIYKPASMNNYCLYALFINILSFFGFEPKSAAKLRLRQTAEYLINITHTQGLYLTNLHEKNKKDMNRPRLTKDLYRPPSVHNHCNYAACVGDPEVVHSLGPRLQIP